MCKHEWSEFRGVKRCILCGRVLNHNGIATRDLPRIIADKRAKNHKVKGRKPNSTI